ncbi:hypothetical protein ACRE_025430 [Hapsidospora chrysogenum ATCC 11550]|uniref:Uncharacterized protein n=1 Tax=Hapsidospora chrysogenum (strain ATCC 11550 / CBS 779.69 / DSM 880 / IAM 14645 / JCM 23072 / IMI 49137) TaxID=857340 RepID=A0A086TBB5_HAPC1|nr:hypothetical protein ACRE_025430 [Hapsidospora chrysogenum ATCC 11550]
MVSSPRRSLADVAASPNAASATDLPLMEAQRPHPHSKGPGAAIPDGPGDDAQDDLEALRRTPLALHPSFYIL